MSAEEKKPAEPAPAAAPAEGAAPAESAAAAAPGVEAKQPGKKSLFLGGGIVGLVAMAWALSLVAVPKGRAQHEAEHHIAGPFMADVSPSAGFQVNLSGDGGKHYLSLKLNVEVDAFEEGYAGARAAQPLYQAKLTDAVLRTASQKTKGELDNAVGREVFRDELRIALDPVLFPVHVGDEHSPDGFHEESGLRAGRSISRASLRGLFYEHQLHLDAGKKSLRLDEGEELTYRGDEVDLFVADAYGKGVYLEVTGVTSDFVGEIPVGAFGHVRNVYFNTFLTQ
ncbi:MAG: flagellar basal body-associated FliL family protein [Planctomycetes bacterium]|nr:flagellar basal body-associated FliL family protein [Planctomycetota bacterium]